MHPSSAQEMVHLLACGNTMALQTVARFLARARQIRRRNKIIFEHKQLQVESSSFACKRTAWRLRGKPCCRHGILFDRMPAGGCKCMYITTSTEEDWAHAKFMPHMNADLKIIVATRFDLSSYERLGVLQARARQFGW